MKTAISYKNVKKFYGDLKAVNGITLNIKEGEFFGLLGPNGAGKSTLLKIISGKQEPTSGHVHLQGGKRMSVLEQNHNAYDEFPVLETVVRGNRDLSLLVVILGYALQIVEASVNAHLLQFDASDDITINATIINNPINIEPPSVGFSFKYSF